MNEWMEVGDKDNRRIKFRPTAHHVSRYFVMQSNNIQAVAKTAADGANDDVIHISGNGMK
ncbi:hypothetical protein D3C85_1792800 [compost metagenome]